MRSENSKRVLLIPKLVTFCRISCKVTDISESLTSPTSCRNHWLLVVSVWRKTNAAAERGFSVIFGRMLFLGKWPPHCPQNKGECPWCFLLKNRSWHSELRSKMNWLGRARRSNTSTELVENMMMIHSRSINSRAFADKNARLLIKPKSKWDQKIQNESYWCL